MPSRKVARVLRGHGAAWVQARPRATVARLEDGESRHVLFVVRGSVVCRAADGAEVVRAPPGSFVGEASLAHARRGV